MERLKAISHWLNGNVGLGYTLVRVYVGCALFVRGWLFLTQSSAIFEQVRQSTGLLSSDAVIYVIAAAHLLGGALLAVGLLTRLAALAQIPVLLGAVFLSVRVEEGFLAAGQSLELSVLVLFLLALVFLFGPGPFALGDRLNWTWQGPRWLDSRVEMAYALIRVYVGIALFVRGWIFASQSSAVFELTARANVDWLLALALMNYVIAVHVLGGVLLAAGMLARLAALVQIPVLLGAVLFFHIEEGLLAAGQSLELSTLVLFLLVVFFLFGPGSYTVDGLLTEERTPERPPRAPDQHRETAEPLPDLPAATATPAGSATAVTVPKPAPARTVPATVPKRTHRPARKGLSMKTHLLCYALALPVFVYRGFEVLFEPREVATSMGPVIADWVLSYFVLPYFLLVTGAFFIASIRRSSTK